nr:hypothetical protein [Rhizobium etli]
MHEADEPNAVADFPESQFLAGWHGRDVDLLAIDADATAMGHQRIAIVEGVIDLRQTLINA